jgi:hypothetical protein
MTDATGHSFVYSEVCGPVDHSFHAEVADRALAFEDTDGRWACRAVDGCARLPSYASQWRCSAETSN